MIQVAAVRGETERAISFLEMAKNERMKPNYATYHGVIYACVRRPEYYKDAFVYFTEMIRSGLLPTADTFTILLYGMMFDFMLVVSSLR
jgi:pentatricopeptide repeat protein